jgi:hypothetical protein
MNPDFAGVPAAGPGKMMSGREHRGGVAIVGSGPLFVAFLVEKSVQLTTHF